MSSCFHLIAPIQILQVLNLTEIEINRIDIRVGLSGGLYFMDRSQQAVRQLNYLSSQVTAFGIFSLVQFNAII